jgi:hypothetical protein
MLAFVKCKETKNTEEKNVQQNFFSQIFSIIILYFVIWWNWLQYISEIWYEKVC